MAQQLVPSDEDLIAAKLSGLHLMDESDDYV